MPQMAPMNWMILFLYFILILTMISSMTFFMFLKNKMNNKFKNKKLINYNKFI